MTSPASPDSTVERIKAGLRGWRRTSRTEPTGALTVSAEKGFLREVGNLVFHFSLLGLLAAIAVGKMFGFEGTVVVTEGGAFCSASPAVYDTFRPGLLIDGTELAPFCVNVDDFTASYDEDGQATDFATAVRYRTGSDAAADPTADPTAGTSATLKVNEPIRLAGERVYLLGHGYSPIFEVTFPNGRTTTATQVFQPGDALMLSEGVVKIADPPGYTGAEALQHQIALEGLFAPTAVVGHDLVMGSSYPAPENPGVAIQAYRGDLGMSDGRPQSIYQLDEDQIASGALQKLDRANLFLGESMTLDDGTVVTFTGYDEWVQLQTSYDPAQGWALFFAITLLGGLMLSLTVKRRRVWYRVQPGSSAGAADAADSASGSRIEIGGLARTDQAGYGEEFDELVALARQPGSG